MLTINYDSWFVRKYLGYSEYSPLPNTICQLGRVIVGMTCLWLILSTAATILASLYLTGWFGVLYVAFTDATLTSFFNLDSKNATWLPMAWTVFILVNIALSIGALIVGVKWCKEYRRIKVRKVAQKNYEATGVWELPASAPSPITEFFKGIWARIHDKTCALIEWKNDPKSKRQREREEEYARYKAEVEKMISSAHNLPEDNT